ncbi:P-loop containing nucleoside triphosphate hydrolase protein [Raphanus sativus]|nr:P-loop containing nucleoside triphosphate hydrolase protein [Raphanus sativus]
MNKILIVRKIEIFTSLSLSLKLSTEKKTCDFFFFSYAHLRSQATPSPSPPPSHGRLRFRKPHISYSCLLRERNPNSIPPHTIPRNLNLMASSSAIRMYPRRLYEVGRTPIQNRSMNNSCFLSNLQMVEENVGLRRVMAQMSLDLKRCKADVVVENNGDLDHLNQQFSMVLSEIRRPLTWIEFWRSRQGAFSVLGLVISGLFVCKRFSY